MYFSFIIFRQKHLQFRPPFEEIKAKYYREIRRFLSIPSNFKGVTNENTIFAAIVQKNSAAFYDLYLKGEELFERLDAAKSQFTDWVAIGAVDVESLAETHLTNLTEWEKNFKMMKLKGREAEKLPS